MNELNSTHRILFMGQKPIGQRAFGRLMAKHICLEVVGVVSNVSLDMWWGDNEIYRVCQIEDIPFIDNAKRNNDAIRQLIDDQKVDCILSVQHSWILPKSIIGAVRRFAFNLHLAPLPSFKGWHGVNHAILQGLDSFGVSLHWLTDEIDNGDMAYPASVTVHPDDTALSLYRRCEEAGLRAFDCLLDDLVTGNTPPRQSLHGEHRYYSSTMLEAYREIKSLENPIETERQVRALYFPPFEPAYIRLANRKIFVTPSYQGA